MHQFTNINGLLELMKSLQGEKTQKEYAKELGVSPQYLCDVYNSRRAPSKGILRYLGADTVYFIPQSLCNTAAIASQEKTNASSQESSKEDYKEKFQVAKENRRRKKR